MPNSKFQYNPVTLTYEKVEVTWRKRLVKISLVLAAGIGMAVMGILSVAPWVKTSREQQLKAENERLRAGLITLRQEQKQNNEVLDNLLNRDKNLYRVTLGAEPLADENRLLGMGGELKTKIAASDEIGKQMSMLERETELLKRRLFAQSLSYDELENQASTWDNRLQSYPSIQPVSNKDLARIASGFGYRIDPHYGTRRMHTGLDFSAPTGTEIYASGDGVVVEVVTKRWGYGKEIVIDHGFGYRTRYAHLSEFKVKRGQKVKRGELIGLVGSTGKSTAPHLHYEVEYNGKKVDPAKYCHGDLSPGEYELLLEKAGNANKSFD